VTFQRLSRRALLLAAPGLWLAGKAGAEPAALRFAVYRNGARIGAHEVAFSGPPEARLVRISADIDVKLGPLKLFTYRHRSSEYWRDEAFHRLESHTETNHRIEKVTAERVRDAVRILTAKGASLAAPPDARPLSHWNRASLGEPLFNPQTGALVRIRTEQTGVKMLSDEDGKPLAVDGVALRGEVDITDWYDKDGRWAGLKARLGDGSMLEYRRASSV
jgi:hypothetical protein